MLSAVLIRNLSSRLSRLRTVPYFVNRNCVRLVCTQNDDEDKGHVDKFSWMDDAIAHGEVHEAPGYIAFDEETWREYEEAGAIRPTESVLEKVKAMESLSDPTHGPEISEQFLKGMLELEGDDLLDIIGVEEDSEPVSSRMNSISIPQPTMSLAEAEKHVLAQERKASDDQLDAVVKPVVNNDETRGLQALAESDVGFQEDNVPLVPLTLSTLPENPKKPGYSKRVMQMESEMSRIVDRTLTCEHPEWDTLGAAILNVALSPNMRDLTVYYDVADETLRANEWRKLLNRITKSVRGEIAKLDIRYAPRVHFQSRKAEDCGQAAQLDDIFAQIAKER